RRGRDESDQGRLRRSRLQPGRLLDEVRDRTLFRRRGRDRGDDVRARRPQRRSAADDELRPSRPGVRPRLRAERGAAGAGGRRPLERDGSRRPQRLCPDREGLMAYDWEEVEAYAEAHSTPPPELFERLAAETRANTDAPQMMVGPVEGALLRFLVA